MTTQADPGRHVHAGQPVLVAGAPLAQARGAVIFVHGRGASAEDILTLAPEIGHARLAYLAPQAAGGTWYPQRFLEPLAANEPWLSSALRVLAEVLAHVHAAGLAHEQIALAGFSQGACLALEYAARHARRYAALLGFSGGLIGPDGTPRDYPGSLAGTPVFLGCSDVDAHIPKARVEHTAEVLRKLGAEVELRLYRGMGHTINAEEIAIARAMLRNLAPE